MHLNYWDTAVSKIFVLLSLLIIGMVPAVLSQPAPEPIDGFAWIETIKLDNDLVVGNIASIDIDNDLLITTDQLGQQVLVFSSSGKYISQLSTEKCNPGHVFAPLASKIENSVIWVASSGTSYMQFDSGGSCIERYNNEVLPTKRWDISPQGELVLLNSFNAEITIIPTPENRNATSFTVRFPEYPQIERRWEGGGVQIHNGHIYLVGVIPDSLVVLNRKDNIISKHALQNRYFGPLPSRDLPDSMTPEFFGRVREMMESSTLVNSFYILNDSTLIFSLREGKSAKFVITNHEGEHRFSGVFPNPSYKLVNASGGFIYLSVQPDIDESSGVIPNPVIFKYKLLVPSHE